MMSDTRTVSAKDTTINMSDTEIASDTETMSEGEITRAKHIQVGGRATRVDRKTMSSLNDVSIEGLVTGARPVCDAVFWRVFLAPADVVTLAGNQDQS